MAALLAPSWKPVPDDPEIELPDPAENDPRKEFSATPVVVLPVLLIVTNGKEPVTVLRFTAGPPVASIVATPAPTEILKPVPAASVVKATALEANRPVPLLVTMSRSVKLK